MKKASRVLGLFILVGSALYGALLKFPQILFPHEVYYKNIHVYSTNDIPNSIYLLMDTVSSSLKQSEFYCEKLVHTVFICNNPFLYGTLSYPSKTTFAGNNLITGNILIASADIKNNLSNRSMDDKTRKLSNLLTHEITHSLLYANLGFKKYFNLPTWKNEGYCDVIAKSSTLTEQEEIQIICDGKYPKSYSYYRLGIEYLMEEGNLSMKEIINQNYDYAKIVENVTLKLCYKCVVKNYPGYLLKK